MRMRRLFAPRAICFLLLLDQVTKLFAYTFLRGREAVRLIPGIFELRYLENQSAAFGVDPISILHSIFHFTYFDEHPESFLHCKMVFFVILTVAVGILIGLFYRRLPAEKHFVPMRFTLLLFFSGAVGNCIDRIWHQYVIDFFYFRLIDFPIFNVADIYVTVAAVLLVFLCFFYYKEEDLERVLPTKGA